MPLDLPENIWSTHACRILLKETCDENCKFSYWFFLGLVLAYFTFRGVTPYPLVYFTGLGIAIGSGICVMTYKPGVIIRTLLVVVPITCAGLFVLIKAHEQEISLWLYLLLFVAVCAIVAVACYLLVRWWKGKKKATQPVLGVVTLNSFTVYPESGLIVTDHGSQFLFVAPDMNDPDYLMKWGEDISEGDDVRKDG